MAELAERGPMQSNGVAKLLVKMENFRDGNSQPELQVIGEVMPPVRSCEHGAESESQ